MQHRTVNSSSRFLLIVTASIAVAGFVAACRKAAPDENTKPPSAMDDDGHGGVSGKSGSQGGSGSNNGHAGSSGGNGLFDASSSGDAMLADGDVVEIRDGGTLDASDIPPTPPFTKRGLLEAFADCALDQSRDFLERVQTLRSAIHEYSASLDAADADAAREAWLAAMRSWQRAEVMSFGPAASSMEPGGQSLRDQIYIFPLSNECKVDQQLVDKAYAKAGFAATLASARGLSAIEYLLFHISSGNACSAAIGINKNGTWDALSNTEIEQRRADYAEAAAKDVLAQAQKLVKAWDPAEGNYRAQIAKAGTSSSMFATDQDAFNTVNSALFYVEKQVKDWKVAWPLGLVADCIHAPSPCPNDVESAYAQVSTNHIKQNLIGFRKLFQGCGPAYSGLGFDDWLTKIGSGVLAKKMQSALENAQDAVDDLDPPLEQAVLADPAALKSVHTALKGVTDPLKTTFVSVLDLELPMSAQGDND